MAPAEFAGGSQERWAPSALCAQEGCHGDIGGCHSDVHPIRAVYHMSYAQKKRTIKYQ